MTSINPPEGIGQNQAPVSRLSLYRDYIKGNIEVIRKDPEATKVLDATERDLGGVYPLLESKLWDTLAMRKSKAYSYKHSAIKTKPLNVSDPRAGRIPRFRDAPSELTADEARAKISYKETKELIAGKSRDEVRALRDAVFKARSIANSAFPEGKFPPLDPVEEGAIKALDEASGRMSIKEQAASGFYRFASALTSLPSKLLNAGYRQIGSMAGRARHLPGMDANPFTKLDALADKSEELKKLADHAAQNHDWETLARAQKESLAVSLDVMDNLDSIYPENPALRALVTKSPLDALQYVIGNERTTDEMLARMEESIGGKVGGAAGEIAEFMWGPSGALIKGGSGLAARVAGKLPGAGKILAGSSRLGAASKTYRVASETAKLGEGLAYYHAVTTADPRLREKLRGSFDAALMAPFYRMAGLLGKGTAKALQRKLPFLPSKVGGSVAEGIAFGPGAEGYGALTHKLLSKIGVGEYDSTRVAPVITAMFERGDLLTQRKVLVSEGRSASPEKRKKIKEQLEALDKRIAEKEALVFDGFAKWGGTAFGMATGSFVFPSEVADFRKNYPEAWKQHRLQKAATVLSRAAGGKNVEKASSDIYKTVEKMARSGVSAEDSKEVTKESKVNIIQKSLEAGARFLKGKGAGWVKLKEPGGGEVEIRAGQRNVAETLESRWTGEGRGLEVRYRGKVLKGDAARKVFEDFTTRAFNNRLRTIEIMTHEGVFETEQEGIYTSEELGGRIRRNSESGRWEVQEKGGEGWVEIAPEKVEKVLGVKPDAKDLDGKVTEVEIEGKAEGSDTLSEKLDSVLAKLDELDPAREYLDSILSWAGYGRDLPLDSAIAWRRLIVRMAAEQYLANPENMTREEIGLGIQDLLREAVKAEVPWADPSFKKEEVKTEEQKIEDEAGFAKSVKDAYEKAYEEESQVELEVKHKKAPKGGKPGRFEYDGKSYTYKSKSNLDAAIEKAKAESLDRRALEKVAKKLGVHPQTLKNEKSKLEDAIEEGKKLKRKPKDEGKEVPQREEEESKPKGKLKPKGAEKKEEPKKEEPKEPAKNKEEGKDDGMVAKFEGSKAPGPDGTSRSIEFKLEGSKQYAKVPTKGDIIRKMSELLGLMPVTGRRLAGSTRKPVLGLFRSGAGRAIWTKYPEDLVTAAHEQGHGIAERYLDKFGKVPGEVKKELRELGIRLYGEEAEEDPSLAVSEGFAEFFARLIFHRSDTFSEVSIDAPNTFAWFSDFLNSKPKVKAIVSDLIEMGTVFSEAGIRGRIEQGGFIEWNADRKFGEKLLSRGRVVAGKRLFLKWFDHDWSILEKYESEVAEAYKERYGVDLPIKSLPAKLRLELGHKSKGVANNVMFGEFVDLEGNPISGAKSLDKILRPWAKKKGDESKIRRVLGLAFAFRGLNYHKNNLDFVASKKELNFYLNDLYKEAKDSGNIGEFKEMLQSAKDLSQFGKNLTRYFWAPATGLDAATLEKLDQFNPFYFPMQRAFDESDIVSTMGIGGKKNSPKPIKRVKGSQRTVSDLFQNLTDHTYRIIGASHRAMIREALVNLHETLADSTLLTEIEPQKTKTTIKLDTILDTVIKETNVEKHEMKVVRDSLEKILDDLGVDADKLLDFYQTKPFESDQSRPTIAFTRNGKTRHFEVNDLSPSLTGAEIYKTLMGHGESDMGGAAPFVRYMKTLVQNGAVGYNIAFSARNVISDGLMFPMTSKHGNGWFGLAKMWGTALTQTFKLDKLPWYGSKKGKAFELYKRIGGRFDTFAGISMESSNKYLRSEILGWHGRLFSLLKRIESVGAFGEMIPRATEFETALIAAKEKAEKANLAYAAGKKGVKQWSNMDILMDAAYDASEVTVNFFRAGTIGRYVGNTIPFFTAQLAGTSRSLRRLREAGEGEGSEKLYNLTKIFMQASSSIIPLAMLEQMLGANDDRWKNLPPDNNLHFFIGDHHLKLKLPHFLGWLFVTMPRRLVARKKGSDIEGMKDIIWQGFRENIPGSDPLDILTPPVAALIESHLNVNAGTGRPIVPNFLVENREPRDQTKDSTSLALEMILQKVPLFKQLNISPAKVDFVMNKITGGLAGNLMLPVEWILQGSGLSDRRKRTGPIALYGGSPSPWIDRRYYAMMKRIKELQQKSGSKSATHKERKELYTLRRLYGTLKPFRLQWRKEFRSEAKKVHSIDWWRKKVGKVLERAIEVMK
jgi:hypothetical protein